jgi:hypothetical protein
VKTAVGAAEPDRPDWWQVTPLWTLNAACPAPAVQTIVWNAAAADPPRISVPLVLTTGCAPQFTGMWFQFDVSS